MMKTKQERAMNLIRIYEKTISEFKKIGLTPKQAIATFVGFAAQLIAKLTLDRINKP